MRVCTICYAHIDHNRRHALYHTVLRRLPDHVLTRVLLLAAPTPQALCSLRLICRHFAFHSYARVWAMAVSDFMQDFGFDDVRIPFSLLRCVGGLVTGPSLLNILFRDSENALHSLGFRYRLEIHIPSTQQALSVSRLLLSKAGFEKQALPISSPIEYARDVMGYTPFGRTIRSMENWTLRKTDAFTAQCTVVVNVSPHSALPSILEYPSTLFMNFLFDGHLHILYPSLTLQRRGLVNVFPKASSLPVTSRRSPCWFADALDSAGFSIAYGIDDVCPPASHRCGFTPSCPTIPRSLGDRLSVRIMVAARASDEGPLTLPFVAWSLKCSASCSTSPLAQDILPRDYSMGQYIVQDSVYEDSFAWWLTGDEDGQNRQEGPPTPAFHSLAYSGSADVLLLHLRA